MQPNSTFQDSPVLGVGMGLRHSLLEETLNATHILDWLEITPENYMGKGGRSTQVLGKALARYPIISHGVSLSIGSADPWDKQYLTDLAELFDTVNPPWFSDHLCFSGISNVYFNDLIPLPQTEATISHLVDRIKFIQDHFQRLFLIENISYYLQYENQPLSDAEFLCNILEKSDCGLLLDVNNVYVNAKNHGFDPYAYLRQIPLERVVQIHVAGHAHYDEGLVDTHGSTVCDDVWTMLDWVLQRTRPGGVMLERDLNIPPFYELEPELLRIRSLWDKTQGVNAQEVVDKERQYAVV